MGLAAIVDGTVTKSNQAEWAKRARWLSLMPAHSERGSYSRYINVKLLPEPPAPTVADALLLALEIKHEPHTQVRLRRGELCQCRFTGCGKFFFTSAPEDWVGSRCSTARHRSRRIG
jgi:hypothetical protein